MAKIKVQNPDRRARRRRDDARHLVVHQRPVDPAVPGRGAEVLRPWHREPRRDRRSDHRRSGRGDQALRGRREVRDDHAGRGARGGVWVEGDVQLSQRDDPQHPRWGDLPRADRDLEHPSAGAELDEADRDRPSRVRRPVPRDRPRRPGRGHADAHVHAEGRRRADRAGRVRLPRARESRWRCTTSTPRSATSRGPRCATGWTAATRCTCRRRTRSSSATTGASRTCSRRSTRTSSRPTSRPRASHTNIA